MLIGTKYRPPVLRPDLVARPRLLERLESGLLSRDTFLRRLTLVSAPPGYGKTSAVCQWLNESRCGVAWVSLDEDDGDQRLFWSYVLAALRQVEPGLCSRADPLLTPPVMSLGQGGPDDRPVYDFMRVLISGLTELKEPLVLVLDDYHRISECAVHNGVAYLLEHLPPRLHVVLCTRAGPSFSLSNLRARRQMVELGQEDLRFSGEEAKQLVGKTSSAKLTAGDIDLLVSHTEGWATGLHLAAMSMRDTADVVRFCSSGAGNRFILDYLMDEVLAHQRDEIKSFLLATSPLPRLTADLCDAVTGCNNSRDLLLELERKNLFVIPLDDQRKWYRYHSMFGELLKDELTESRPDMASTLLRRAGDWYESTGLYQEAIDAFLAAGDVERTACLLDRHIEELWTGGSQGQLLHWIESLPREEVDRHLRLSMFYALLLLIHGRPVEARAVAGAAEKLAATDERGRNVSPPSPTDPDEARGVIRIVQAYSSLFLSDVAGFFSAADGLLDCFSGRGSLWRGAAAAVCGDALAFGGDMTGAHRLYTEAIEDSRTAADPFLRLYIAQKAGIMLWVAGKLTSAADLCRSQLDLAVRQGFSRLSRTGGLWALVGEVLRERNQLEQARECIERGIQLGQHEETVLAWARFCLIRLLFSEGRLDVLPRALDEMESTVSGSIAWLSDSVSNWRARLWIERGELDEAARWLTLDQPRGPIQFWKLDNCLTEARYLAACGREADATSLLECLIDTADQRSWARASVEGRIVQALACHKVGRVDAAMNYLTTALVCGEREGYIRMFADEGQPMRLLLEEARSCSMLTPSGYRVLAVCRSVARNDTSPSGFTPPTAYDLSPREVQVIRLAASGLSNREVARRLSLSVNTVKWHMQNIFQKLNVSNRTEAAVRAKEARLVP